MHLQRYSKDSSPDDMNASKSKTEGDVNVDDGTNSMQNVIQLRSINGVPNIIPINVNYLKLLTIILTKSNLDTDEWVITRT